MDAHRTAAKYFDRRVAHRDEPRDDWILTQTDLSQHKLSDAQLQRKKEQRKSKYHDIAAILYAQKLDALRDGRLPLRKSGPMPLQQNGGALGERRGAAERGNRAQPSRCRQSRHRSLSPKRAHYEGLMLLEVDPACRYEAPRRIGKARAPSSTLKGFESDHDSDIAAWGYESDDTDAYGAADGVCTAIRAEHALRSEKHVLDEAQTAVDQLRSIIRSVNSCAETGWPSLDRTSSHFCRP